MTAGKTLAAIIPRCSLLRDQDQPGVMPEKKPAKQNTKVIVAHYPMTVVITSLFHVYIAS